MILKTRKYLYETLIFDTRTNSRDLTQVIGVCRDTINSLLIQNGIWMVHGHLCPVYEHSGRRDDGVQFAIIDSKYMTSQLAEFGEKI